MNPLEVEKFIPAVEFPYFGAVVVRDKEFAVYAAQRFPQTEVILPREPAVIDIFALKVRRIAVDEIAGPVVMPD